MTVTHPGLPDYWAGIIVAFMSLTILWVLAKPTPAQIRTSNLSLVKMPFVGNGIRQLVTSRWLLLSLKFVLVGFFLLIIYAGLFGTPIPERNFATMVTWNLWWSGLVFSVFFLGSAWCAVCPWDTLAQWLVRRKLWRRAEPNNSLNLKVPKWLANVWPALLMFIGLTWLELGVGITTSPYATAAVSLLMVVLATASLAIFQRKAFCRYFCPVGRTVGYYSQLAPIELRSIDNDTCLNCTTLDCYHGNDKIEPCPTWLVMGRLKQNSYCTSCGNCTQSCPHENIAWRFRPPSAEALHGARPHWDESWFMLGLLALTGFHGLTMMPFWEVWMSQLAQTIGDSGRLLPSFTIGLILCLIIIAAIYSIFIAITKKIIDNEIHSDIHNNIEYKRLFSIFAFVSLPLAFAYHLAHNLNHLIRESVGIAAVFINPLGVDTVPLSMLEKHERHTTMWLSQDALFSIQAGLMIFGFWIAIQIIRYRGKNIITKDADITDLKKSLKLTPMLAFASGITAFHLWLLMQPMIMRM
ncbi:Nitrogen assimilation regulatory protein [hydrothermal vent metagenome]|uniref:Nitrogen assimilation regulatory protein n=1 Tax=hydrothermal vent metagenome TaxID=652676 RepID=A0A3B0X0N1_9ZZZZ